MNKKKTKTVCQQDFLDSLRFLNAFIPDRSLEATRYIIGEWMEFYEDKRHEIAAKWQEMDQLADKLLSGSQVNPAAVSELIGKSIPQSLCGLPFWKKKSIRIAGRDMDADEILNDKFVRLLVWTGVLAINKGEIVPGALLNEKGQYIYPGLSGALTNFGHIAANQRWRSLFIGVVAEQYNLQAIDGHDTLEQLQITGNKLDDFVSLLKQVVASSKDVFDEPYSCMPTADAFYTQCLYAYNRLIKAMYVFSRTSGTVIPVEESGSTLELKHTARLDYFRYGLRGKDTAETPIYYQWDRHTTAEKLAEEQQKAETAGRGQEHKQKSIEILSEYLALANFELSESSFSGPWTWKNFFTLVSDRRVAFSNREPHLKKIAHGIWIDHEHREFLADSLKKSAAAVKASAEREGLPDCEVPDAAGVYDMVDFLYNVDNKRVIKRAGETVENPRSYAREVIEDLLARGKMD